jgi:nucleoside-diphosphate-sugar epimerase
MGHEVQVPARGDRGVLTRDLGVVFYCAGLTADFDSRPFDTVEAHVALVNDIARAGRFEKLVYLSSTRLYDGLDVARADESAPLRLQPSSPRHTYDLSKALGENIVLTRTGGRGSVARLSNVFDWSAGAPGFLSEWLVEAGKRRNLTLASSPHIARDYIHLDDVVDSLIVMAAGASPGIINVASGELVTNAQIAGVMAAAGWTVDFTGDADPPRAPDADIARLTTLGVKPRPVKDVVRAYLESLG